MRQEVLSRYAPGSLVVPYAVYSRFVPALYSRRASSLVHVLFVLLFESRNRGLAGFGWAIDTIPLIRNV